MSDAVYRYCPTCGGPLEARTLKTGDRERLACAACGFVLYLDPKVAVGTIISPGVSDVSAACSSPVFGDFNSPL